MSAWSSDNVPNDLLTRVYFDHRAATKTILGFTIHSALSVVSAERPGRIVRKQPHLTMIRVPTMNTASRPNPTLLGYPRSTRLARQDPVELLECWMGPGRNGWSDKFHETTGSAERKANKDTPVTLLQQVQAFGSTSGSCIFHFLRIDVTVLFSLSPSLVFSLSSPLGRQHHHVLSLALWFQAPRCVFKLATF